MLPRSASVFILGALALLLAAHPATPRVWTVYDDGSGDAPTIQAAIDSSTAGDHVLVYAGTYAEHVTMKDGVSLLGAEGPDVTTIQAPLTVTWDPTITAAGIGSSTILWGFTIGGGGQAVGLFGTNCSMEIIHNRFLNNVAWDIPPPPEFPFAGGAAITLLDAGSPRIIDNTFEGNAYITYHGMGAVGGTLFVESAETATIEGNLFQNNGPAGGVSVLGDCTIRRNTLLRNSDQEEGIGADYGVATIEENIVASTSGQQQMTPYGPTYPNTFGIRAYIRGGVIRRNTVIGTGVCYAYGPPDSGEVWGGISAYVRDNDPLTIRVEQNLVVANGRVGIKIYDPGRTSISCNLTYHNADDLIGIAPDPGHLFVDPLLCDPANDDLRLRSDSPARTSLCGLIGAVDETCETVVSVGPAATPDITLLAVPNPFNPTTTIHASVPVPGRLTIEVYDVRGTKVRTLFDRTISAGEVEVEWDGSDRFDSRAASGVYFVRALASNLLKTEKIVLLK